MPFLTNLNPFTVATPEQIKHRRVSTFTTRAGSLVKDLQADMRAKFQQAQAKVFADQARERVQAEQGRNVFLTRIGPKLAAKGAEDFRQRNQERLKAGFDFGESVPVDAASADRGLERAGALLVDQPKIVQVMFDFYREYPDGRVEKATKEEVEEAKARGAIEKRSGKGPFESILPEKALETVGKAPVVGESLENVTRGVTSPVGLATLPVGGFGGTASKVLASSLGGSVLGGTIGGEIAGDWGRLAGELGGGLTGGLAPAAARRLARTPLGRTAIEDARLAPERGGARIPKFGDLTDDELRDAAERLFREGKVDLFSRGPMGEDNYGNLLPRSRRQIISALENEAAPAGGGARIPPEEPPVPPGRGGMKPAARTPADDAFIAAADPSPLPGAIRGEDPGETLIRQSGGALETGDIEAALKVSEGNKLLADAKMGQRYQGTVAPLPEQKGEFLELHRYLNNASKVESGEMAVPARMRPVYDKARELTDFEQAARLDFDPEMATVDDYFYRGWKVPKESTMKTRQGLVFKPGFMKPRANATFDEMLESGFEPLYLNPFEQWRVSRKMGIRYRQQMGLVEELKTRGVAIPHDGGPVPEGWRVPEVGPAFEGKPFAITDEAGNARPLFTRRWLTPDSLANRLELVYGKRPKIGDQELFGRQVNLDKIVDTLAFTPKRAKLVGSVFQHVDLLTRNYIGSWHGMVDALQHGKPVAAVKHLAVWPQSASKLARAMVSPNYEQQLQRMALDTQPVIAGRPGLTMKAISEAGLSTRMTTIVPEDIDTVVSELAREGATAKVLKSIPRTVAALERVTRQGLFQRFYPAAILTDVKNNITPIMVRNFPQETDAQIAARVAKFANTRYGTTPAAMSTITNKFLRPTLERLLFSLGETEGLLRQATGAIGGANPGVWRSNWLAAYLGLMTAANVIHYASTGELLPAARYSPISKDKWGPLPFGYNRDFASPNIPLTGRSGAELTLDVVGQLDTAFRILDPQNFITARFSVPVRTIQNQVQGQDFFGAPIDQVGPDGIISRTSQAIIDMFAPIGVGSAALEVARNNIAGLEKIIQPGEDRLGTAGSLVQSSGVNLRAETTPKLLDRWAQESGLKKADGTPVERWDDLEPNQKKQAEGDEELQRELKLRSEVGVLRGQGKGFAALEDVDKRRLDEERAAVQLFRQTGDGPALLRQAQDISATAAAERSQVDRDYGLFESSGKLPTDPGKRALVQYYAVFDKARLPGGGLDYDRLELEMSKLERAWTAAQKGYVDRNTRLTEHLPEVQQALDASRLYSDLRNTVPKYQQLTAAEGRKLDAFINDVSDEAARTGIPFRAVAVDMGEKRNAPNLVEWAILLQNSKARANLLNPAYDRFIFDHRAQLEPFFPDLFTAARARRAGEPIGVEE